jgi:RimJ/RimL family protein N-acetyltransferase
MADHRMLAAAGPADGVEISGAGHAALTLPAVWPPFGLRLVAGDLELRPVRDEDLPALVELAKRGIHPPDAMPFSTPWTNAPAERLPAAMAAYFWAVRAETRPERWSLNLVVRHLGEVVGLQGVSTHDFLVTRTGETGSWLGLQHQGHGIGTRMRRAICALCFDHLDFAEVTSGAFVDNPASLAVSRKVGYRENGETRMVRRAGELAVNRRLVLTPETFVRGDRLDVEGLPPLRAFLGLDPRS